MNRNKSVSSMNSQEGGGGLTQLGNKSIAPTIAANSNTASALAMSSARSTSLLQSDRASLIRPFSAQSPSDSMKFKKRDLSGGKAQDFLENTLSDGGDPAFMDTQKQLIMPSISAMDDNQSLRKLKSTDMNDQLIKGVASTAATSNNGKKSLQMNNFLTPAGAAGVSNKNLLNPPSPSKMPQSDSTSNLGLSVLDQSTSGGQGSVANMYDLRDMTSQHLVVMAEVENNDKLLKDETALRIHLTGHIGVKVSRMRLIGEPMIKNLCKVINDLQIQHLRFEECKIHHKGLAALKEYFINSSQLRSFGLVQMKFEVQQDLKVIIEGIIKCITIRQVIFNNMHINDKKLLEPLKKLVNETKYIQELDISQCQIASKIFTEFIQCIGNSKVQRLIMQGNQIGHIESLVMRQLFNNSQSVRYIDISRSIGNQKYFDFIKLGVNSQIRVLIMDEIDVDISAQLPEIGKAFGANMRMEVVSMKKNKKIQVDPNSSKGASSWYDGQVQFWKALMPNRYIQVMHLEDMNINWQTCECIAQYLEQYNVQVTELNLENNKIGKKGVKFLAQALRINNRLKILRLGHNHLNEDGINELQEALSENDTLEELYLNHNKLEDIGAGYLANFLDINYTLKILDISKNKITSQGLELFSQKLASNHGLLSLFLGENMVLYESEDGIKALGNCLGINKSLKVLDMNGVKINKHKQDLYINDNLKKNIFLQQIIISKALSIDIIQQLKNNVDIENKIIKNKHLKQDGSKLVLDLRGEPSVLVIPAIKLIENLHIIEVDFSGMDMSDLEMIEIANYLKDNLSLKKLTLSFNHFITDYGIIRIAEALTKNDKLEKLNFGQCNLLTHNCIEQMINLVKDLNITLWDISCEKNDGNNYQTKSTDLVLEAKLNQNILHVLKPNPKNNSKNNSGQGGRIKEVKFDPQAPIQKCFKSALKCWRIMQPLCIDLCNQQLQDEQIQMLSELLKNDLSSIERLILRRNYIKDDGAKALSRFIKQDPEFFNYLEISRNEISDVGAQYILKALKKNTKLTTLLLEYGNQIENTKLMRDIEQEIAANVLIKDEVKNCLIPDSTTFGRLCINDKGPTYLRCAIKAIEKFDLIELNLSDNLLEYEQAVMIANMIILDRPLKILNLSKNRFKIDSARVISNAIVQNQHLYHIDLSNNELSDAGIALIIYQIAQQSLRKSMFQAGMMKSKKKDDWLNIKEKEKEMKIKILNLEKNDHGKESLKHVLALLNANNTIVIDIDIPDIDAQKQSENGEKNNKTSENTDKVDADKQQVSMVTLQGPLAISGEEQKQKNEGSDESKAETQKNWRTLIGRFGEAIDYIRPQVSPRKLVHQIQTGPTQEEQEAAKKAEEQAKVNEEKAAKEAKKNKKKGGLAQRARANKKKGKNTVNPDGGESHHDLERGMQDEDPETKIKRAEEQAQILLEEEKKKKGCYRCRQKCQRSDESKSSLFFLNELREIYAQEQRTARLFKCNEKILIEVEYVSQQYISIWMYISTFLYYFTALLIPLTEEDSCKNGHDRKLFLYYAVYAIFSGIMEVLICFYIERVVENKDIFKVSKFHLWKIISGQLARVDLLTDVLFITQMNWCGNYGIVAASTIVLLISGAYQFIMPFKLLKTNSGSLVKKIDRNCKLAYVTEHVGIAIILDSFSLSNFETLGRDSVAIPKIISMIKCYTEDLPQFLIQVVFILFFSDKKNDSTGVVVSILLGLISFAMSISTAISAKSSDVDVDKLKLKLEERKKQMELSCEHDIKTFIKEGKENLTKKYDDNQAQKKDAESINIEKRHLDGFSKNLQYFAKSMSKTKDGKILPSQQKRLLEDKQRFMSQGKKNTVADEIETSLLIGDANKQQDTSTTNLVQKPSISNAQSPFKPRPDSAATSSSETDKGNKKDLIMKDNKQLNIKDNLLPTNPGSSPTSNSKKS